MTLKIFWYLVPKVIAAFTGQSGLWNVAIAAVTDVQNRLEDGSLSKEDRAAVFAAHISPYLKRVASPAFWLNLLRELAVFYVRNQTGEVTPK